MGTTILKEKHKSQILQSIFSHFFLGGGEAQKTANQPILMALVCLTELNFKFILIWIVPIDETALGGEHKFFCSWRKTA